MHYFDAHIHISDISLDVLTDMALANIRGVVAPIQIPVGRPISADGVIDIWNMQLEEFTMRPKSRLIDVYSMMGLSMVCTPDPADVDKLLVKLEDYLKLPNVVAIGEVGFELNSPTNKDEDFQRGLYEAQLDVAKKCGVRVDVHTSYAPERKVKYTHECLELAVKHGFDLDKLIIDHCTPDNIDIVLDAGAYAAISCQPWRGITPQITADMLMKYNSDRIMVDSDSCGGDPSDPLTVAKIAYELELRGADQGLIEKACALNCKKAYGIA